MGQQELTLHAWLRRLEEGIPIRQVLDLSALSPNIGDESRTDVSAYWVKGNGLKV